MRLGEWKLIENLSCRYQPCVPSRMLFNLKEDPYEREDLSGSGLPIAEELEALIRIYVGESERLEARLLREETEVDEGLRRQLEALGYVQ